MNRANLKLGLGTLLIVIAYFALTFTWLSRDRSMQNRILDLSTERDIVEQRLRDSEATNLQMKRMLEASKLSAGSAMWAMPRGVDIETLSPKIVLAARSLALLMAELDRTPSRWATFDNEAFVVWLGKESIPSRQAEQALEVFLKDGTEAQTRLAAANLLMRLTQLTSATILENGMQKDESARVREICALALGERRSPTSQQSLSHTLLNDPSQEVRLAAAKALCQYAGEPTLDALAKAFRTDPIVENRVGLVDAMRRFAGNKFKLVLAEGLLDPSPAVRAASEDLLDERSALQLPIADLMYSEVSGADFRAFLQAGTAKRVVRMGDYVYFEVDSEVVTAGARKPERRWYRAPDR